MATKKEKEQLESLLDWKREGGRLPKTKKLVNIEICGGLVLREVKDKLWALEFTKYEEETNNITCHIIEHPSLIQLGLSILESVKFVEDRWFKER